MDLRQCPCSGKTLARLVQPAVMAALAEHPLHGYLIVQRLAALRMFRDQKPDPTGVYRLLKALEQEGYVESTWELAENGPAKRRFALTKSGRTCLARWAQTLQEYEESVGDLLGVITQAMRHGTRVTSQRARRISRCSGSHGCCVNASRS